MNSVKIWLIAIAALAQAVLGPTTVHAQTPQPEGTPPPAEETEEAKPVPATQPAAPAETPPEETKPASPTSEEVKPSASGAGAESAPAPASETTETRPALPESQAKKKSSILTEIWSRTALSTLWYLSYGHGKDEGKRFNKAHVGRGYVTLKLKPVKWFQPRVTMDTHQDEEGDWKVRLKYLYGKFILPIETAVITEPNIELGIVHNPWFDFEEHINNYRMEGTMFTERNGMMNSADLGATVGGLLGRKLSKEYQERVSREYPGQYGSFALGIYNGGGYHAKETNNDKVFEARITLRPLSLFDIPNLQISYFTVFGKGNTEQTPDWRLHDVMLSFEHQFLVLVGHFAIGRGNQKGKQVDDQGKALDFAGGSGFAEIKLPWIRSSVIGRYDYWDWDTDGGESATARVIAGYAFYFFGDNFALVSLDHLTYTEADQPADWQAKVTLQVHLY